MYILAIFYHIDKNIKTKDNILTNILINVLMNIYDDIYLNSLINIYNSEA